MIPIVERLQMQIPLLYDGAKGTFLAPHVEIGIPTDILNLTKPEVVANTLKAYVDAGSAMVQTNTFCANKIRLASNDLADQTYEINLQGARIARELAGDKVYVAGDIGPTGQLLQSEGGDYTAEQMKQAFIPQIRGLLNGGVDVLHIETMSSLAEVLAAIQAINEVKSGFPTMVTMTFESKKPHQFHTMMGVKPAELITLADQHRLLAHGANCGIGPDGSDELIKQLRGEDNTPRILVAKLNAGLPQMIGDQTVYPKGPQDMAEYATHMYDLGVKIIGACCGSTPLHIEAMANALARIT